MEFKKMRFIDPEKKHPKKKEQVRPASYIRKEFDVKKKVRKATLYMTALGVYKGFLNGEELDNRLLLPGFTYYTKRLQVQEYDVTDRIVVGKNAIGAVLGEGWYRGSIGAWGNKNYYGDVLGLAVKLVLTYANGKKEIIETDPSWKATQNGPLQNNDIKTYETYDATLEMPGWTEPDFDDREWHTCKTMSYKGELIPHEGLPVLDHERFTPKVITTPNGETVLDFGQNLAGHVEFTVTGKAGQTVTLEMGETFDENGNFTMGNIEDESGIFSFLVGQKLTYTLKEGTQTYKSLFLISGYRLVRISNWPEEVKPENFTSIAVYSDMPAVSTFACSNDKINQFHKNISWGWRSNSVEIPTDCPTRERGGWTGDANVFSESAAWLTNNKQFMHKWLGDFMSQQTRDGNLPYIVPNVEIYPGKMNEITDGCAAWADGIISIPMTLYDFYGDKTELEYIYPSAKRFVDFNLKRSRKGFSRKYLLTKGWHFGEWLEPGTSMFSEGLKAFFKADSEVTTAWLYRSTLQLSQVAGILGKPEEEAKYAKLAQKIRKAYRSKYLKDGMVHSKRQCRYVRPVYMGLADPEECPAIVEKLSEMARANEYKIGTGFLTTYQVLKVLCDYGHVDIAYKIMENEKCPGWMYEINKGATTVWENWNGIDEQGRVDNSQNHYSPGAVAAWLYTHVGGIRPAAPGFEKVLIKPIPGGSVTWANTSYDSVRGTVSTSWKLENGNFKLHVEVPAGVSTTVVLPDGSEHPLTATTGDFTCAMGK